MKVLEPENHEGLTLLSTGDILVDVDLGTYILMNFDGLYIFKPTFGSNSGYNGRHDSLESITERAMDSIRRKGDKVKIYRSKHYDLQLVPK